MFVPKGGDGTKKFGNHWSNRKLKDNQLDNRDPEEEENLLTLLSQPSKMWKERSPGLLQSWGNTS
ncbi:hypothetical protein M514_12270 [Trichuris suis]|uniref:Uncharacterized protein n=1 Tax=Trichuris suis TaxID=68888 RepID=A0A085MSJ0_9BILA|nr:hypothetical protein M513_12270 [Trichuris suis]KFD60186.1 hypothetical protein M514_12270 [Trichuris suis]